MAEISKGLQERFDIHKKSPEEIKTLGLYFDALGIDPELQEQCIKVAQKINAKLGEFKKIESLVIQENDTIKHVGNRAHRIHTVATQVANNSDFRDIA